MLRHCISGIFSFAIVMLFAGRVHAGVSSGNVNDITPVCVGSSLTFVAQTNAENADITNPGHDYGDVAFSPNPAWFYFKVDTGGVLELEQTNSNNVDVDGVLWGPFDSVSDLVRDGVSSSYGTSLLIDSDYEASADFNFSVTADAGEFYVLLISNYSESATDISLNSGASTVATTDCAVTYGIDLQVDTATLSTTEGGATASYGIRLYRQPSADVSVNLASTINEVTLSVPSLTFTTANWDVAQSVTLAAVDDSVLDGHLTDTIVHTASSTDTNYNGRTAEVAVVADDNDLSVPTVNVLLTNDSTPTLSGSHDSPSVLSVTVDFVTYTEGDGYLTDNADNTWTLVVPTEVSAGTHNVAATSTFGAYTQSDSTNNELTIDDTNPVPTLSINSITSDDVINTSESSGAVIVSGVVGGEFAITDTVKVTVDGNNFTDTVDGTGAYSVSIAGTLLAANTMVSASVVTTEASGNTGSAVASRIFTVDTVDPEPYIDLDSITVDNVVNASEAGGTIIINGVVSQDFTTGDAVLLSVGADSYAGATNSDGSFSISVPGSVLELTTTISASVSTSDTAGNTGTATDELIYTVDTMLPVASISVDDITSDNVLNISESSSTNSVSGAVAGEFLAGNIVTLTVNGATFTSTVASDGSYNIEVPGAQLAADTAVRASIAASDAAGNTAIANVLKTYTTDLEAPVPTIALNNVTADNVVNSAESIADITLTGAVGGGFTVGDTVTLVVNDSSFTDRVDGSGNFSVDVPGSDVAADSSVAVSVVATDAAGNSTALASTLDYTVDTTLPIATMTVNVITSDDVINSAEAGGAVVVSGLVSGEFTAGDTVTVTVDGTDFTTIVDGYGAYGVSISGALLAENSTIDASIAATDGSGNIGASDISYGYSVDTVAPVPNIVLDNVTTDNVVNVAEATSPIIITGFVTGDFTTGDAVQLFVGANNYTGSAGADGNFSISVPGRDLESAITVSASVSTIDAAGNTGSATDVLNYAVDTILPVASIIVEDITADNVINIGESSSTIAVRGSVAGEYLAGDIVTLVVNGASFTGSVSSEGTFDIDLPGAQLAADSLVDASIVSTDTAGNFAVANTDKPYTVDLTAPAPSVALGNVTEDNVVNSVESVATITLAGIVSGEFIAGDTVTVTIDGMNFTTTVDGAGAYGISVAGMLLAENSMVDVSIEATDASGNIASGRVSLNYTVDTIDPVPTITLDSITTDNVLNASESEGTINITGVVSGDFLTGDAVELTIAETVYRGVANIDGSFSISVPGAVLERANSLSASVSTIDASGNTGSAIDVHSYTVDTLFPIATISVADITEDNIVNIDESVGTITVNGTVSGQFITGDIVSLVVNGETLTDSVSGAGTFAMNFPGAQLAEDTSVDASIVATDTAGNSATANHLKSYTVDIMAPVLDVQIDAISNDNIINAAEARNTVVVTGAVSGEFIPGGTVSIAVNSQEFSSNVDVDGGFRIDVPGSGLIEDSIATASFTSTDVAGNTITRTETQSYSVDITMPELSAASLSLDGSSTPEIGGTTDADVGANINVVDSNNTTVCIATVIAETPENTWSCTSQSPLPNGKITITASIADEAGNIATVSIPIVVDTIIPFLEGTDQTLIDSATPMLSGVTNEPAGSIVSITNASDDSVCSATVSSDGSWSCLPLMPLNEKTHEFIATITDDFGNTAMAEFSVTVDFDYDDDGIPNLLEGVSDSDLDGIPNFLDTDSDGDGISDLDEGGQDADGDQIPNYIDLDADGDGLPDELEASSAESTAPDSDADGTPDYLDRDSDNDGADDTLEGAIDTDGDGLANWIDPDSDNDGISDEEEGTVDTDSDGLPDSVDLDSDNDRIPDRQESSGDSDSDGVPNYRDLDSDNDGLSDAQEAGGLDTDADGVINVVPDTDGDGVSDYVDLDSDNDGLSDLVESAGLEADADRDAQVDEFVDVDGDGLDDGVGVVPLTREDTDSDGIPDYLDLDTDNDGVFDLVEAGGQDRDGDGVNDVQADMDGDGIPDSVDVDQTMGSDADADGIDDSADVDFVPVADTDGDGIVDSSDPDPDGDGIADILFDGGSHTSQDIRLPDIDSDGIPDLKEANAVGPLRTGRDGSGCSVSGSSGSHSPFLMFIATMAMLTLLIRRHAAVVVVLISALALGGALDSVTNVAMADVLAEPLSHVKILSPEFRMDDQHGDRIKRTIYAGIGFGISRLDPDTSAQDGTDVIDGDHLSGQLTLGVDFNKWFSLELHGAELGSAELSSGGGINYREFGSSVLFYAGKNRHRFKRRGLSAFGRIGYGVLSNDREGDPVSFVQENNTHTLYGAGIEYAGRRGLGVRAEVICFDADVRNGQLGIIYRFGEPLQRRAFPVVERGRTDIPDVESAKPVSTQKSGDSSGTRIVDQTPSARDMVGILLAVNFNSGSDALTPVAKRHLDDLLPIMEVHSTLRFKVSGHADDRGDAEHNLMLSKKRARAVVRYLARGGIAVRQLITRAYGESYPIASNRTAEGRLANRRVELSALSPGGRTK